jgi:hypothetical protein
MYLSWLSASLKHSFSAKSGPTSMERRVIQCSDVALYKYLKAFETYESFRRCVKSCLTVLLYHSCVGT